MSLRSRPRPKKAARALPLRFDTLETRQLLSVGLGGSSSTSGTGPLPSSGPVHSTPPVTAPKPGDWLAHPLDIYHQVTAPTKGTTGGGLRTSGGSATPAAAAPYSPVQVRHAYGFDQLTEDGTGQTIAIVDAYGSSSIAADLKSFDTQFGLVDPNLIIAQPGGVPGPDPTGGSWGIETSLDVEWAHAIAPNATILLVEAATAYFSDLTVGINYAVAQGASQVSMSFGGTEYSGDLANDSTFQVPGVTFLASAGDNSAGDGSTTPTLIYPSSSPYVVSVGGTNLKLNGPGNSRSSETAWGDGNLADGGTGGGYSTVEPKPSYQAGFVAGTARGTPDVSYNADPNTGVYVLDSALGGYYEIGGTSAGAPQWAGLVALVNQGRQANGSSALGQGKAFGADVPIYAQAGTGSYTNASGDFVDITSGSNGYPATVGWDPSTGLGSPAANKLVPDLIGVIVPTIPGTLKDGFFTGYTTGSGQAAYRYRPSGTAWTFGGTAGVSGNASAFTSNNPASPAGPQVAFIQNNGTVNQTIQSLTAGSYQLSFSAAQRGNYQASREDFTVTLDGVTVGTFTPTGLSYNPYATALFAVSAGNHVIGFQGLDTAGGDNTALIGNVTLGVASNNAPVLGDAGLETPVLAAGSAVADPSGTPWTFAGSSGIAANGSAYTSSNPTAPEGSQVAFLEQQGSFTQSPTGWLAGSYQITFSAAQRGSVNPSREDFKVLIDGVAVATFAPTGVAYLTYTTPTFTVTAGTHSISFQGLDTAGGDNTALIDGVVTSLTKVTPSVVPALAAAPTLGDAGFETVSAGAGFLVDPAGSAWTFSGPSGVAANGSAYTSSNPTAPDGTQVAFLQTTGSFTQTVAGWTAGTYLVSFSSAQRGVLQASRQDFEVLIDGKVVNTFAPSSSGYMTYWTAPFTVTAGAHSITFQGLDSAGNDNTALIDGVSVVTAS